MASDESFSGWTRTFTDPRLCAAIVDRLTFAGNITETGTDSYRLARPRLPNRPAPGSQPQFHSQPRTSRGSRCP
ncbi:ATP-binding protein [Actinomadura oligospora]|uniref:ATP-binding protein n=1 Tax=Actinomadura oligospora TaxID=111804 RepID=UPI002480F7D6|nr:ATP-binding protein [Actinomadura oligospora]